VGKGDFAVVKLNIQLSARKNTKKYMNRHGNGPGIRGKCRIIHQFLFLSRRPIRKPLRPGDNVDTF
jgi:hypothetical protein